MTWVNIHMPFITTRAKCAVLTDSCADLIVGNVDGVIEVDDRIIEEWTRQNDLKDCPDNAVTRKQWALRKSESEKDEVDSIITTPSKKLTQPDIQHTVQPETVKHKHSQGPVQNRN